MSLDIITDENYASIKAAPTAILVVGMNSCGSCQTYLPIVDAVSKIFPDLFCGYVALDTKGVAMRTIKEELIPDPKSIAIPDTHFFREGNHLGHETGNLSAEMLVHRLAHYFPEVFR